MILEFMRIRGKSIGRMVSRAAPVIALLCVFAAGCDDELPIQPHESRFSEAGLLLSTYSINFDPTFLGRTSASQISVEYGDTLNVRVYLSLSDTSTFSVSPDSLLFTRVARTAKITVNYHPADTDTVHHAKLFLVTAGWADTFHVALDTLGQDSVSLAGTGASYFLDMEMIFIPGGTFVMGTDSASVDSVTSENRDEMPAHNVTLSDFFIGRYEVTNIQYYEFWQENSVGHTPADTAVMGRWPQVALDKPNFPVIGVSWYDALAFCNWLSLRTGERYTLPSEAQWEYVARGGADRLYPWSTPGAEPSDTSSQTVPQSLLANVREGGDGYTFTAPVDAFAAGASAFGPLNMAGNVAEWCLDWYDPEYYSRNEVWVDPGGPKDIEHSFFKVVRGGSWLQPITSARTNNRAAISPQNREINVGFRVVRLP